ncbi:MAG: ribonuclease Y [Chloroflexi bacterium]|nr:ribonuclease Y [Chloroflexota bacterium]
MDISLIAIIVALTAIIVGFTLGFKFHNIYSSRSIKATKEATEQQLARANSRSKEILLEAKEESLKVRSETEKKINEQRSEIQALSNKIHAKEESIELKQRTLIEEEKNLSHKKNKLKSEMDSLEENKNKINIELEKVSGLSLANAKEKLFQTAEKEIEFEISKKYRDSDLLAQDDYEQKAKMILSETMQRYASEVVSEVSISRITLPNEDMKGRLIGREGRNIRSIESATGVDVIIDEVPETITISCFDPIRREIAKLTIEELIRDGRINPSRVEETMRRVKRDLDSNIKKIGQKATFDVNVKGLHPELIYHLGMLDYRYSYGENVLNHSKEVGSIAGMLASQIGANVEIAKTAGFLHDIGKSLTHEIDGPHAIIGGDLAKKLGQNDKVVTAIKEHHDTEMTTIESFLVAAADAISAARPGARSDSIENYIERLDALEKIALRFDGVINVYAIQAGREVRILVNPEEVNDIEASKLARNITKKIEEELQYPGQIKIIVIRESRIEEMAK